MSSAFNNVLLLCLLLAALPQTASGAPAAAQKPTSGEGAGGPGAGAEQPRIKALIAAARTHRELRQPKEAEAALIAAEALVRAGTPSEASLRLAQAELEIEGGKPEAALARVERALAVMRQHPDKALETMALRLKARALYTLGCLARDAAANVNDEAHTPRALRWIGQAMSQLDFVAPGAPAATSIAPLGEREQDDFTALWLSYAMPFAAFKWTQKFKSLALRNELTQTNATGPSPAARLAPAIALDRVGEFLPPDTMLLDYAALEGATIKHSQGDLADPVVCFRVEAGTGEPTLRWGGLRGLRCADLRREVEKFRRLCATEDVQVEEAAQRLYRTLLAPIEAELRGKKRLIICADGPLRNLPFHALMKPAAGGNGPRFLIEDFEIVYAYSASAVGAALAANPTPLTQASVLVINDPTEGKTLPALAHAREEEAAIRDALPLVETLRGAAATEAVVRAALGRHSIIHFAGHTIIDDRTPWKSGLQLAPSPGSDGVLSAAEILDMRFSPSLVVFSSCRTAGGSAVDGDGLAGLAGAVFAAGARSQVLTLWEVVDRSAPDFMRPLYAFLASGKSRAEAMQGAARKMIASKQFRHPRYWAPFVLWGDWR